MQQQLAQVLGVSVATWVGGARDMRQGLAQVLGESLGEVGA